MQLDMCLFLEGIFSDDLSGRTGLWIERECEPARSTILSRQWEISGVSVILNTGSTLMESTAGIQYRGLRDLCLPRASIDSLSIHQSNGQTGKRLNNQIICPVTEYFSIHDRILRCSLPHYNVDNSLTLDHYHI